jgi:hypothetical protein
MVFMIFSICRLELPYPPTSDHLSVLFEVELDVRRKVPEHFVFDYRNADSALFQRVDLNFSLDRVESEADVDYMV